MIRSWLALLIGAALIQGLLTFSPIPVPEDEWEQYSTLLRDPAYRLPITTRPRHYELSITPTFDVVTEINVSPFTFEGDVTIYTSTTMINVNEIVMHCDDITIRSITVSQNNVTIPLTTDTFECELPYNFLRITTVQVLEFDTEYTIRIIYTGNIQSGMRGFYRSWYTDASNNGTRRWMGTTQFQPGHARKAFPCYDEPGMKATFDITVVRQNGFSPTISNMPIKTSTPVGNGRTSETFYTTPLTSTYLLAFIVSHYKVVSTNNNATHPFEIYARDNAGTTGDWSLEIGELLLEAMDKYTNIPYFTMADRMVMQQAAIPDFSAGAMENWGLLTYREALILYDPLNSNHFYKQRIANIVSHEITHMWFGNLVTCAWWDNLWLNEGFARHYQYYLTHMVAPELGFDTRFIVEQIHTVMLSDSVDSAHALTNPNVNDPTSVSAHFSAITYAKGAAVIRMTKYLMGESTFIKGLQRYLAARQYNVAEPHHLFEALDAAAEEDNTISDYGGITIRSYFTTWSEQAGHPILNVNINHATGRMRVTQSRWERDTGVSQIQSQWEIPVTWTRAGAADFEDLKPSQVLRLTTTTIERGTEGLEWVIFNKQETGFYKVNYDDTNWSLITRALRGRNRTVIHELNRAQIVDDLFVFARAGIKTYNRVFNILSFLEFEDAYAPWIAAIAGYNFALRRLAFDTFNLQILQNQIINQSVAVTARLGYSDIEGEPFMDGLLRMYVLTFLCNIGHSDCQNAARTNFQLWKNGGYIPPNMRPWVYCSGLRQGNADDFDYFWDRYLNEDLASEIVVMLQNAGCTTDQSRLEVLLDAIVSGNDTVRPQDHTTALNSAVTGNENNTMRVFDWVKRNVESLNNTFGSAATPLSYIAARLTSEAQINEFLQWLEDNQNVIGPSAYTTGVNGANTARNNLLWSAVRVTEFIQFFEHGYVDGDDIEEDKDDGEEDNEDDEDDEDVDDSANVNVLSIVTLLLTVSINLMS